MQEQNLLPGNKTKCYPRAEHENCAHEKNLDLGRKTYSQDKYSLTYQLMRSVCNEGSQLFKAECLVLLASFSRSWSYSYCAYLYVAVLCRNRRLFRSIFRSHCWVQSTISLNFCVTHTRFVGSLAIYAEVYMNLALNRSSSITALQTQLCDQNTWQNNRWFLHVTVLSFVNAFMYCLNHFTDTCKMKAKNPQGLKLQKL